jgi:hypothetical protein
VGISVKIFQPRFLAVEMTVHTLYTLQMDEALKRKLDAAEVRISNKFSVTGATSEEQRNGMRKAKAVFPHLRMSFSEVEIAQIRERFEEIDSGTVPKEIDPNSDAETPNGRFAFEYYFLKNLLDT